jgi:hypothetical protein
MPFLVPYKAQHHDVGDRRLKVKANSASKTSHVKFVFARDMRDTRRFLPLYINIKPLHQVHHTYNISTHNNLQTIYD